MLPPIAFAPDAVLASAADANPTDDRYAARCADFAAVAQHLNQRLANKVPF
ncbi:MAG TPA: hypothetical protein VJY39_01735 [Acidisphaera sp.]|nr:hypothetical protein [Acidisphaera sp.]